MRKRNWTLLGVIALTLPALSKVAAEPRHDATIGRVAEAYRQAVLSGDSGAVGATYARDAVEMPPCRSPLEGRAAIQQYYGELFGIGKVKDFTFTLRETATAGNVGFAAGGYQRTLLLKSGEAMEDSGSFVVIVKRDANAWKSAYVIYNGDRAPASRGAIGPAFISPFRALVNYYASIAGQRLLWFAAFALACACFGPLARVIRRIITSRSGLEAHRA